MPTSIFLLVNAAFFLSAFYLAHRLIPKQWTWLAKACAWLPLLALSSSFPLYFITRPLRSGDASSLSSNLITYSMGFFSLLLTFTVIRDVIWLIFKQSPWKKNISSERRDFLRNASRAGVLGVTTAVFGTAVHSALARPTIQRVSIAVADLPTALEGFTIAQISDVHVGQLKNQTEYLAQIIDAVNSCQADIVAITGDIVDGSVTRLAQDVAPLANLKSKYGNFFVTGNHEYYSGVLPWIDQFKKLGWNVLENEHRTLSIGAHQVVIAGVHDLKAGQRISTHACSPSQALSGAPADSAFTLLLAHHPGTAKLTDGLNIDLQISGHTHAGQYFPATWLVHWVHPYAQGLNFHNGMQVYVNSGTGYWGPALRTTDVIGEVTLLSLTRA